MTCPLISIVIPLFNRVDLIKETINSIINQTYWNWEAIIVDDGSSDGSVLTVANFASLDSRIKFYNRGSCVKGASACRNEGARMSKGEYLIFLDSDDLLAPWCLSTRVEFMEVNPHLGFAVFPILFFYHKILDTDLGWGEQKIIDDLLYFTNGDSPWQTTSPIWRREAYNIIGEWDTRALSWQDWEYHIRAVLSGIQYEKVKTLPDAFYRCGGQEKMSNHKRSMERITALHELISIMDDLIVEKVKNPVKYRRRLCAHYFIMAEVIAFYQYPADLKAFYGIVSKKKMVSRSIYSMSLSLLLVYNFVKKRNVPFFGGIMRSFFKSRLMSFCFQTENYSNKFMLSQEQFSTLKHLLKSTNLSLSENKL